MVVSGFIIFFLLFGICHGETCSCSSYLISEDGLSNENQISEMTYDVDESRCDGDGLMMCKGFCEEMYRNLTDNGKLCQKKPGEDLRHADWMCQELKRDVCNGRIGVFAQNCQNEPIDTGFRFVETLCCKDGYSLYC